jgi:Kef-type K+ transport system membrane component KefB/predicted transcriptional regulator
MLPVLLSLGILYLLALGAGRISTSLGIPRVTGYLAVGVAAGPSVGGMMGIPGVITTGQFHALIPVHDMILGLIVFTIGGSFSLKAVRKIGSGLFVVSAFEIGLTALLVGAGTYLLTRSVLVAGFLAVMSVTTAPAATQMVIRECQSEGPLTDTILPLIGINNLLAIVVFILLGNLLPDAAGSVSKTAYQLAVPVGLGIGIGLLTAVMDQRLTRQVDLQILVLAAVFISVGLAGFLEVSAMLATLFAGVATVNASPFRDRTIKDLSVVDYPLYVLFFIMAGAELHLESLVHMGWIGAVYVVLRSAGKYFGCTLGAFAAGASHVQKRWLGPAMLAQAGLAIGLAGTLARSWPGPGQSIQTVVLAAVVVFEVAGPFLTRWSLVNAGEVTVLNLMALRSPVGFTEGLGQAVHQVKDAFGIALSGAANHRAGICVSHIMRRNVEAIPNDTPFDEVLKALGHSRYDQLPVVNRQNELMGVIKYGDIADTLFEPGLRHIVVAGDIATRVPLKLTPDDSIETAMEALKKHPGNTWLVVVDKNDPKKLLGMVRHNDVLSTHLYQDAESNSR